MKKTVLLDLRDLDHPTCGFGQIAINYAQHFSHLSLPDLRFMFLVPEGYAKNYGGDVECVEMRREYKRHTERLPRVDLWHSVHQQQSVRRVEGSTKFLFTIHDLNFLTEKNWLRQLKHKVVLQHRINQAAAVTAISGFVGQQAERHLRLAGKTFRVIYDAVENIAQKPQAEPSFFRGRPFFFSIGQIRKKKNFHLLLDVMKEFPDYDLFICGDDHFAWADTIRRRLAKEQINNVFLTGKISDEARIWLYAHCRAYLFPSQGEGFGLPAIEAMQFGKPVFVANATCLPEITGGHAYVWQALDAKTMCDTLREGLAHYDANPQQAETLKQHASTFSYEHHVEQYIQLYREILNLPTP